MDRSATRRVRLSDSALAATAGRVSVPSYDRDALTPAIVHIGVGGFHRSHQAAYLDRLAESGASLGWGVVGVGLNRRDMHEALAPQDCLYTLLERDAGGDRARVVGSIRRCLFAPDDPGAVLAALTDPRTRLVTLTITGAGYNVDLGTGCFDHADPSVAADLADPAAPGTFFGYLVEALDRRRRAGVAPFTILSCDNVPGNGHVARTALVEFACMRDELLARWIDSNVAFPSSMVDRITPQTTDRDCRHLLGEFGIEDRWPVVAEPFSQWVVEDTFCNGRPPLEEVGVRFVSDVEPYKLMKTRLLNGGHCAIGYLGYLAGHRGIAEAMGDPLLRRYVEELMEGEIAPLLPPMPDIDFGSYSRTLVERFSNPKVGDRLERLCGRGSTKMPSYLLPSIHDARAQGRPHDLLTLAVAGWVRYLRGVDYAGRPINVEDAHGARLRALARQGGTDPRPILRDGGVFGELAHDADFAGSLGRALRDLDARGPQAALRTHVDRHAVGTRAA